MNTVALQQFKVRDQNVDQLVGAHADLVRLKASYTECGVPVPEWIDVKIEEIKLEINAQLRAERQAELAKLKARRQALATPDEKRKALDDEIAALEAKV